MSIEDTEFSEIFTTMLGNESDECTGEKSINRAHLQLLLVLPPQSQDLLPQHLRPLMSDIQHGCVHYYPHDFEVNTYLKNKMWECSPLIPPVNRTKLLQGMQSLQSLQAVKNTTDTSA
jgi:5'-3' exonuclease